MQENGGFSLPIDVVTDARALHEVIISPMEPKPKDPGCLLWIKWLREGHQKNILRRPIWTSTVDMLGDGLTKDKENVELRKLFNTGVVRCRYAILVGTAIVDGHKGRPPTKKEKEEQGYGITYTLVESLIEAYFCQESGKVL